MNKEFLKFIALTSLSCICLFLSTIPVFSQIQVKENLQDSIISPTEANRQVRFHDPRAPRFLLTDSDGKFALGIGGHARAVIEYDFGGIVDHVDFYPSLIASPHNGNYARNQFQMDASASSIYLKLVGTNTKIGDFLVYVNGYFRGNGTTFKLHNAYASLLGFTIGFDYGLFTDATAAPPTIDFEGPAGLVLYRTTQLRYVYTFLKNWNAGISIEVPQVSATTNENLAVNTQRSPDIPAYIQYNWGANSHFRLAGIFRSMTYTSKVAQKAYTANGWGVQATTLFNLSKKLKTSAQITYGEGIANFINDLSTQSVDLVPCLTSANKMQTIPMLGWFACIQYNLSPSVFISGTYSQSRLYSENGYPEIKTELYQYGQYLATNLFWNALPSLQIGIEYLWGKKNNFDKTDYATNRISTLMKYSF